MPPNFAVWFQGGAAAVFAVCAKSDQGPLRRAARRLQAFLPHGPLRVLVLVGLMETMERRATRLRNKQGLPCERRWRSLSPGPFEAHLSAARHAASSAPIPRRPYTRKIAAWHRLLSCQQKGMRILWAWWAASVGNRHLFSSFVLPVASLNGLLGPVAASGVCLAGGLGLVWAA